MTSFIIQIMFVTTCASEKEELGEGLDAVSDDLEDVEDLLYGEEDEDEYELDDLEEGG